MLEDRQRIVALEEVLADYVMRYGATGAARRIFHLSPATKGVSLPGERDQRAIQHTC